LFFFFYRSGLLLRDIRCWGSWGGGGLLQWLVSRGSVRPRRGLGLVLFDKIPGEQAVLPGAALVGVFSDIPIVALLLCDGDDLSHGKVEVVLVGRRVLVDGLDLEARHRGLWAGGGNRTLEQGRPLGERRQWQVLSPPDAG
jgi:hypothetical protein